MKLVKNSPESTTIEFSIEQLALLRDALRKVVEIEVEVTIRTAIHLSPEEARELELKIEEFIENFNGLSGRAVTLSNAELSSMRNLLFETHYNALVPNLPSYFRSRAGIVEHTMDFLA